MEKCPEVTGIVLKTISNADSQVLALKNGEIDVVTDLTPAVAQSLVGDKNISVYSINDTGAYEVAFNTAQYPANYLCLPACHEPRGRTGRPLVLSSVPVVRPTPPF